ncbi:glycosyltransferase family 4 protein (plasmid) [Sphingobium sp. JS3065]|uniref:glycosyltransferase family 4 protein n=1 Tax=Sphingobium sp. JS3065 TaxID=2970925 RepID=UPI0022648713|nr:glycosyltransferase family 4 protein [Sphingobium sp. JS3065]UZW58061.1 glycosyltransferase family 4 protein [Sphingobium sp. JS3065]
MARVLLNGSHPHYLYNFRTHLVKSMIARGHIVHVSSPGLTGRFADHFRALSAIPHDVPLERTKVSFFGDMGYCYNIHRLIVEEKIDLVLNYTIKPNIWGSIAARLAGVRSVSMVTGLGFAFISRKGFVRRLTQMVAQRLYRIAANGNNHVIFQNPDDRDDFIRAGCLSDPRKVIMTNGSGVDLQQYARQPLPDAPIFLTIARLLYSKGLSELVEAAQIVRGAVPEARFQFAGMLDTGPDAVSRKQLDAWITSGIEYLGHLEDVRPAIASATVFVLPSWREGTPRTVLEAMATGRAIVTTTAAGCRETTIDGENGYLVSVQNTQALAEAMIDLAKNAHKRQQMGDASRRLAEEKYDVHKVNSKLLNELGL